MLIVLGVINLASTGFGNATVMLGRFWGLPLVLAATTVLLVLPSTREFCRRPVGA
ncbi:hypothetical protein ABZ805_18325 [Saccharopolyspora sp. NPDC047091]|uniref:hypothetical protein n=1 Tax=Saccharopolyspora sp. NPDC047091 TaxID=3155924 RepID=UPI0033E0F820